MSGVPPLRLAILLEDLKPGCAQRYALQLLEHLDRKWFVPELWLLSDSEMFASLAAGTPVVRMSKASRVGPMALARLARRLWRHPPDLIYTLTAAPNFWGRLFAGLLRIPVVCGYRGPFPQQGERLPHRFSSRVIVDAAETPDIIGARLKIEPGRIAVISSASDTEQVALDDAAKFSVAPVRQTERVLQEVGQLGTEWTVTADGHLPPEVPLWEEPVSGASRDVILERGRFRPDRAVERVARPTLTAFLPPAEQATKIAMIICPGGGYGHVTIDREGYEIGRWLAANGIAGIVLKYRLPRPDVTGGDTPWPLQDSARALQLVRERAEEWQIDPTRIGAIGFSAGGHIVAATTGLAFAVMVYPVITMERGVTHSGSRLRLLGRHPDPALVERYSLERNVTAQTPTSFLVHARDDKDVPVANSIRYAEALRAAGVDHELLLFERGGHGFGLGAPGSDVAAWPARLLVWLRARYPLA